MIHEILIFALKKQYRFTEMYLDVYYIAVLLLTYTINCKYKLVQIHSTTTSQRFKLKSKQKVKGK